MYKYSIVHIQYSLGAFRKKNLNILFLLCIYIQLSQCYPIIFVSEHIMTTHLDTIEINPQQTATASVIWLHGLGADGHDFAGILPALNLPADHRIRFIFPHAPIQPVTINMGMPMRAWFDVLSLEADNRYDLSGILQTENTVHALIENELQRGVASNNIVLIGFSQGGATVLFSGLRYQKPLAGIAALSSFLPAADHFAESDFSANLTTPIFMAHGKQDAVVRYAWGEKSCQVLREHGHQVSWHRYNMAHEVCPEEVTDLRNWLLSVID